MAPVSDVEVEVSSVPDLGGRGRREGGLSRDDCLCPVCLDIFVEPVTLPCTHTFCKGCFLESVDKSTLCCPMCRKRVSTWARQNSRTNTLVNQQLWRQIQTCFPRQCERRLSGQDADDGDRPVSVCLHRVSQPGELRQEYEDQVTKLSEERRVLDEEERRASEEFIQRLLAEEEQLLQEERRRKEEDEQLAKRLSNQLNPPPVSQGNLRVVDVTPAKKKKKEVGVGQMEKFLCPRAPPTSSGCSFLSNKENILLAERRLPKLDYYGAQTDPRPPPEEEPLTTHGGPSPAKRKSSELEDREEEEEITKRGCPFLSSPSSSSSSLGVGVLALQGMAELEAELQGRRQQEEEDRRMALLLQKELNQEARRRATDRRKGSADAYLLRQGRGGRDEEEEEEEEGRFHTPSRRSRKTASTSSSSSSSASSLKSSSSSSSASSLKSSSSSSSTSSLKALKPSSSSSSSSSRRGSKQTTLTEMFSTLTS